MRRKGFCHAGAEVTKYSGDMSQPFGLEASRPSDKGGDDHHNVSQLYRRSVSHEVEEDMIRSRRFRDEGTRTRNHNGRAQRQIRLTESEPTPLIAPKPGRPGC